MGVPWQEKKNYGFWPLGVAEPPLWPHGQTLQIFFLEGLALWGGRTILKGHEGGSKTYNFNFNFFFQLYYCIIFI
jgi:hypothetical protein